MEQRNDRIPYSPAFTPTLKKMQYLVDGHNLVPKIGLRLDSFDDEDDLIARLQEFCRLRRARVEVYFDGAPAGFPAVRRAGAVTAHFVRRGSSADAAIEKRLQQLGIQARNWAVVSSDARVRTAAQAVHARALSSEEFTRLVTSAAQVEISTGDAPPLSTQEVEEWERAFKAGKTENS